MSPLRVSDCVQVSRTCVSNLFCDLFFGHLGNFRLLREHYCGKNGSHSHHSVVCLVFQCHTPSTVSKGIHMCLKLCGSTFVMHIACCDGK